MTVGGDDFGDDEDEDIDAKGKGDLRSYRCNNSKCYIFGLFSLLGSLNMRDIGCIRSRNQSKTQYLASSEDVDPALFSTLNVLIFVEMS